jgi:hypothetical protein
MRILSSLSQVTANFPCAFCPLMAIVALSTAPMNISLQMNKWRKEERKEGRNKGMNESMVFKFLEWQIKARGGG